MAAQQKAEGHFAEHHLDLHNYLKDKFNLDRVDVHGSTQTKTDVIGFRGEQTVRFSVKFGSIKNTQVWLPTLNSLCEAVPAFSTVRDQLNQWLGTYDSALFESWQATKSLTAAEVRRQRVGSDKIDNWDQVLEVFNQETQNCNILRPMLQAKGTEDPVQYLVWINKKKGGIEVVDMPKLIEHIVANSVWSNSQTKRGEHYNLWCNDKTTDKRIFHLQMKGSGIGDYHCPMFHIHNNWPKELVVFEDPNFKI